jgi:hypothetical protein
MDIQITPETRISELKASFSKRFPNLKIEFFSGTTRKIVGDEQLEVQQLSGRKPQGSLHITGLTTVAEMEKLFIQRYGLHAEVFRQSGNVWLQTTATDSWTLDEQNHEARESLRPVSPQKEETDYHEQE